MKCISTDRLIYATYFPFYAHPDIVVKEGRLDLSRPLHGDHGLENVINLFYQKNLNLMQSNSDVAT